MSAPSSSSHHHHHHHEAKSDAPAAAASTSLSPQMSVHGIDENILHEMKLFSGTANEQV
jgi:hypothetical protein